MEKYYCLECYHMFERNIPRLVNCPACHSKSVFWSTSPFIAEYASYYLPKEVLSALESISYKFNKEEFVD